MENAFRINTNYLFLDLTNNQGITAEFKGIVANPSDASKIMQSYFESLKETPYIDVVFPNADRHGCTTSGFSHGIPGIVEVMHKTNNNHQATIIRWSDGTKTCAVCGEGETYDPYTGFMAAVMKKLFGSTGKAKFIHEHKDLEGMKAKKLADEKRAEKEAAEAKAKWEAENAERIAAKKAKAAQKRAKNKAEDEKRRIEELAEQIRIEFLAEKKARDMIDQESKAEE